MPLCTMSQWGWHTSPRPPSLEGAALRLVRYDTHGRQVGYQTSSENQAELFNWLRENPHRLHLGQLGLRLTRGDGAEARAADITDIEQRLDLWSGTITSRFRFDGRPVTVKTSVHPRLDLLAVAVESSLIEEGRLAVRLAFPYGSPEDARRRLGAARAAPLRTRRALEQPRRDSPRARRRPLLGRARVAHARDARRREGAPLSADARGARPASRIRRTLLAAPLRPNAPDRARDVRRFRRPLATLLDDGRRGRAGREPRPARARTRTPRRALAVPHGDPVRGVAAAAGDGPRGQQLVRQVSP